MKKILLVEDDEAIIKVLEYTLSKEYDIDIAKNKLETIKYLRNNYDLLILDISLPDGTSFELLDNIKTPIIFLSAHDEEETILKGLRQAEDYITKPFSMGQLLVRIEKVLQRTKSNKIISYKNIKINDDLQTITVDDNSIPITYLEYHIIYLLFNNVNKIITRDRLANLIYDITGKYVEDNTISVYIKRIREKLNINYIKTIKKVGYVINEE